jgi:hypothetical protein
MTSESVLHFSARTAADAKLGKVECAPLASSQMVSGESSQYLTGMHRKCAKMTPIMTPFIV